MAGLRSLFPSESFVELKPAIHWKKFLPSHSPAAAANTERVLGQHSGVMTCSTFYSADLISSVLSIKITVIFGL